MDGGVLLSHPFLAAKADGCTHVLIIRTRSSNSSAGRLTLGRRLMAQRLERLQPGMRNAALATIQEYHGVAAQLRQQSASRSGPPYVLDVACPDGSHQVGRFTQDRAHIFQGMRVAYGSMLTALTGHVSQVLLKPVGYDDEKQDGGSLAAET